MREKLTEIVTRIKSNAHFVFDACQQDIANNKLAIRL
jgi:glucose-6-phosphate 1-dehydrogenase